MVGQFQVFAGTPFLRQKVLGFWCQYVVFRLPGLPAERRAHSHVRGMKLKLM